MRLRTLVATLILGASTLLRAQTPSQPQLPKRIEIGDASIRGRVIDQGTQQPISRALITLAPVVPSATNLVTETDADGRYAFEHVPAGRYRVTTAHPSYVASVFGSNPQTSGPLDGQVTIERKEARNDVNFALIVGGEISGRVLRHDGEPLKAARVIAHLLFGDGGFSILPESAVRTNDRGEYRFRNLPPGRYDISAMWKEGDSLSSSLFEVPRSSQTASPPRPIFYPSATAAHERVSVPAAAGATVRNIDIIFPATELLRIAGKIVHGSSEGAVEAFLMTGPAMQPITVRSDGTFTTPLLRAGRYTIVARTAQDSPEAAAVSLDLSFDLDDVVVGLKPMGVIAGRVVTDDGTPVSNEMQVAAVLSDEGKELDDYRRDRSEIGPGGEFRIHNLFGQRLMRIVGVTAGWKIARVTVGKQEVTTLSVESGETIEDVVIVLTRS
jgi:hypothetical protein